MGQEGHGPGTQDGGPGTRDSGRQAFGDADQLVGAAHNHAAAAGGDQSFLLPAAQRPAHRKQRRPSHLREVLAGEREIDLDAGLDAAAGVAGEPEEGAGDTPLDPFGHQLAMLPSGESFVFTQFSGEPQCFLSAEQLLAELADAGFTPDPGVPLTEYNRRPYGALRAGGPPVIYECAFRYAGDATPIPIPL